MHSMVPNPDLEVEAEAQMHCYRCLRWTFFPNVVSSGEGVELYYVDRTAVQQQLRNLSPDMMAEGEEAGGEAEESCPIPIGCVSPWLLLHHFYQKSDLKGA